MQSPSVHQFQERARINDLNVMPLRDEVFGLSMGCAFCVTGENTRVLISDNQQRHLFGYSFDSDDAKFCGQVFGCVACDREHAGEYGDMSCQSACRIDLGGACGDGTFATGGFLQDVAKRKTKNTLGAKDDLSSCPSILARVVMLEIELQFAFQMGKAMPAVSDELGPCFPRDLDAVHPMDSGADLPRIFSSSRDGAAVECAVLDHGLTFEHLAKAGEYLPKGWCASDRGCADACEAHVEVVKVLLGVNEKRLASDLAVPADAGQADLANAAAPRIRSLNIKGDEAEILIDGDDREGLFNLNSLCLRLCGGRIVPFCVVSAKGGPVFFFGGFPAGWPAFWCLDAFYDDGRRVNCDRYGTEQGRFLPLRLRGGDQLPAKQPVQKAHLVILPATHGRDYRISTTFHHREDAA